jgi:putative ABC transport system substrate-binding protein
VKRREFILSGCAAAAWPLAARAQQPGIPAIGFLNAGSAEPRAHLVAAFRTGLSGVGYLEGSSVLIEYRWAQDTFGDLPALATELVNCHVRAIAAPGGLPAPLAARTVTHSIPIIFSVGEDPVRLGLVDSLNRPGGNVTGVSYFTNELTAKRLGILRELVSGPARIALLINPNSPDVEDRVKTARAAATGMGFIIDIRRASNDDEIAKSFDVLVQNRSAALLIDADPLFTSRRTQLVSLSIRHAIPAIFTSREFAEAGALMSYGVNLKEVYRLVGVYTGRILKGEQPADLPVVQPTNFEFVINLTTAKTLGLSIPPGVLAIADEVIE